MTAAQRAHSPAPGSSHAGNAARSSDSPAARLSPSGDPITRAGAGVEGVG